MGISRYIFLAHSKPLTSQILVLMSEINVWKNLAFICLFKIPISIRERCCCIIRPERSAFRTIKIIYQGGEWALGWGKRGYKRKLKEERMTCGKMNSKKMETASSDSFQYERGNAQNLYAWDGQGDNLPIWCSEKSSLSFQFAYSSAG